MAKFVMECPECGRYTEASTGVLGLFATKKIECTCGHIIDVKTEKIASKVCAHCGNMVIYDQSKGENAICPVCHEKINTRESMASLVEFSCPSCSCRLSADKNAEKYVCPLCETEIDVQKQIKKEAVKNQGVASVIKYEGGNDIFVWKHPIEDFNLGSQLIVHESQEAIFFRDGEALDLFAGGRYTLPTQNIPVLENLYTLPSGTAEVFHSEVYFVNLVTQMGIKWGTPSKVGVFDPISGLHVQVGACGEFSLKVKDSRRIVLKLVGTSGSFSQREVMGEEIGSNGYSTSLVVGKFKPLIVSAVKNNLAKIIKSLGINILEIDEYVDVLSASMRNAINETLEEYGLYMPEFFITSISLPDDDPNFRRLKQQFADKTLRVREEEIRKAEAQAAQERKLLEAQTEAQLKMVGAQGEAEALKIKAMAEAEAYKAQAMAEAEEMRAKGYTYSQETSRQVGLQAMKNGITGSEGGSGAGSSIIGDIAGLGLTLGAMGGVIDMTKDALNPMMQNAAGIGAASVNKGSSSDTWDCSCGKKGISSKFCPECGATKPAPKETWDCSCGKKGITSKFCPECGAKKPEPPAAWDCSCGKKGIISKFCPECGAKRPEAPTSWICPNCGEKDIKGKFCPECGTKKEG